jgi:hypothetical protein
LGNVNKHKKEIKKFFNWDANYQNQFKNFSTFLHKTKLSGIEERSKSSKVLHKGLKVQIEKSLRGPLKGPGKFQGFEETEVSRVFDMWGRLTKSC